MRLKLIILSVFALSPLANANTLRLDEAVSAFLGASADSSMQVLVSYPSKLTKNQNLSANNFEKVRIEQVAENERALFSSPGLASISEKETLWIANATLMSVTRAQLQALSKSPNVKSITSANTPATINEISPTPSGAGNTWGLEKIGMGSMRLNYPALDGRGIRVGILDTGIDGEHPDLKGKTKLYKDFVDPAIVLPRDDQGHGTHVAGTIAGGMASGAYIGVATGADLLVGKAFDSTGSSKIKNLLLAMQWIADPDGNPSTPDAPQIVANSWAVGGKFGDRIPADEPLCAAVETLANLGILPVFAAGNMGYAKGSVQLPAACPSAFSVGATDERDQIAVFSSRGPAQWRNVKLPKPEVSAPGTNVISADPGGAFKTRSGTSMAAPHVVGALALLLQAKPGMSSEELKKALLDGVRDLGPAGSDSDFGAGRIDVLQSMQKLLP